MSEMDYLVIAFRTDFVFKNQSKKVQKLQNSNSNKYEIVIPKVCFQSKITDHFLKHEILYNCF